MFDRKNLNRSLAELGAAESASIFDELKTAYTQPERHYHSDNHVAECLKHFERLRSLAIHPSEIQVAIWFHDAVYDTHQSDNEEQSAEWARSYLEGAGVSLESTTRIVRMILATKTHKPHDADAEIMLDIDLGILGTSAEVFESYDKAIRREYHWVPEEQYCVGRAQVLSSFLDRPNIYHTQLFSQQYESQARENLSRKIEELRLTCS